MGIQPRILVVENSEILRVILFTMLRHQPLEVDTAASAAEALARMGRCEYALVLVDLDAPQEEIETLFAGIREIRGDDSQLIFAVRDPGRKSVNVPPATCAVLSKPLELDVLAELVRECAHAAPPPQRDDACPPAESDVRARLVRASTESN